MITLTVNGSDRQVARDTDLAELLTLLSLSPSLVVAELNGVLVAREKFAETLFNNGDRLELVTVVGGG